MSPPLDARRERLAAILYSKYDGYDSVNNEEWQRLKDYYPLLAES